MEFVKVFLKGFREGFKPGKSGKPVVTEGTGNACRPFRSGD